jgi:hypothetical protein
MSSLDKPLRSAMKAPSRTSSPGDSSRVPLPPDPNFPSSTSSDPSTPLLKPVSDLIGSPLTRTASNPLQSVSGASTDETPVGSTLAPHKKFVVKEPQHHEPPTSHSPLPSALHVRHHSGGSSTPYTPKVSFDTFENPIASMFSFTLQTKSAGYKRTRNTRVYLCAASPDESGQEALDWCLESLVQDGDEVIVFRGVEEDLLEKDHDILREEARVLMKTLEAKNMEVDSERKLSLILEYIPGKITDSIDRLIALYRPDSLIVGTRGKRGIMGLNLSGIGSVSK